MHRIVLALLIAVTACGPGQPDQTAACATLLASAWSAEDTREQLVAKVTSSAEAYEVFAAATEGDIQADFAALADTFTNFDGYLNHDPDVGYDELISQVDVETVRQSGRVIEYLNANC